MKDKNSCSTKGMKKSGKDKKHPDEKQAIKLIKKKMKKECMK